MLSFSGICQANDSVVVEFKPIPVANTPPNLTICSTSGTGEFMLTDNDSEILGTQDPADFEISYHLLEQDAIDNINPLDKSLYKRSNPQTIFVRMAELTQECFDTTSFNLEFTNLNINTVLTPLARL